MKMLRATAVFFGLCLAAQVAGSWSNDPTVNVPLCNAVGNQAGNGLLAVWSIEGGIIAAWQDDRHADTDIYAQRANSQGESQWVVDGVPVCTAAGSQLWLQGTSDGAGGAILVWLDLRDGESDLFAQRIDADGSIMWPVGSPSLDGVPVCADSEHQSWAQVVSDGAGGAIVSWEQGTNPNALHAQRLDPDGEIQWPTGSPSESGVAVSATNGVKIWSRMVPDGVGGAVLAWTDGRNNPTTNFDIYAQRISGSGVTLWPGDVPVCTKTSGQKYPAIAAVASGGAFLTWFHSNEEIWAQHINHNGTSQWTTDGIMIVDSSVDGMFTLRGVADGRGGAVFVWEDLRDYVTTGRDLFAQRLTSTGPVWPAGGVIISAATGDQKEPAIGSPRDGSVVIAWTDYRVGGGSSDVYALEITEGTVFSGPPNGLAVSTADYGQYGSVIGASGFGDAVLVWKDSRNLPTLVDVYAQGVFLSAIFADGFESGDSTVWSATAP